MSAAILSQLHRVCEGVCSGSMTRSQAVRLMREYFVGEGADPLARMGFAPKKDAHGIRELASIPRLELIVYQNVKMAQERGHYEQWKQVKDDFQYGVWRCGHCAHHREKHLARDGKAYSFDHPIWTQSPPGGEYNCHCYRELASARDLADMGIHPQPLSSDFEPSSLGFDPSRPLEPPPMGKTVLPQYKAAAEKKMQEFREQPDQELIRRQEEQRRLEALAAAQAEAERLARESEAARLEQERLAKEEAERIAREEAERKAREEAARQEAERLAREEAAHKAKEETVPVPSVDVKTAAERRLEQIPGVQKVDFDGWKDEDGIKAVADQMERLSKEYDVPPPFSRLLVKPICDNRGRESTGIGGSTWNRDYYELRRGPKGYERVLMAQAGQIDINIKLLERVPELRAKWTTDADGRYMEAACFFLKGREAVCIATHEFGHRILGEFDKRGDMQKVSDYIEMVYKQHKKGWVVGLDVIDVRSEISQYAASNWKEFWCECFSYYKCGDRERLPRDIRIMVSTVLSCIQKENPHAVSELDNVIKLFRKEYKTLKTNHATIDEFGQQHVIIDTEGRKISHNEIPRIDGPLPDYPREKAENHPLPEGDPSGDSEAEKQKQREQCRRDIEALQPGLADQAQQAYDQMDAIERDVVHAYTMRDLYDINSKIFKMYRENDKDPKTKHSISDYLSEIERFEIERRLRVLEKLPRFKGTVYRGMKFTTADEVTLFKRKWEMGSSVYGRN